MKNTLLVITLFLFSCHSKGQLKIISFPPLTDFVPTEYSKTNNIIPIAIIDLSKKGIPDKIPISYSMLHNSVDSTNFFIKGDNIDNYSFKILDNGKFQPLFTFNTLKIPDNWSIYLEKTIRKVDSVKSKTDLKSLINFYKEPEWWQNDATPLTEDGKPMRFICQIELRSITTDDCCLYIFYDSKKRIVKQIYQRD